jgi:hypothetical protein
MNPQTNIISPHYLICPICGRGKIISEENESDDHIITLLTPGVKRKAHWHVKCHVCKAQVGFSFQRVKRKTKKLLGPIDGPCPVKQELWKNE